MKNAISTLKKNFIERYGDLKYSKKHKFIGHERGRTETHVIVGYSYRYFGSAETVILQYLIPISEWDNPKLFPTFKQYTDGCPSCLKSLNEDGWFMGIGFDFSIDSFFMEDISDKLSTEAERKHRKNPPYESQDRPVDNSWDDDYLDGCDYYPCDEDTEE